MDIFYYIIIFIFGTIIGSFLNCVIYRLEVEEEFVKKRSYCPHCKKALDWRDLVPVLSFLFLQGKCRNCGLKISWQYPLIEILTGLIFLLIFNFEFLILNEFFPQTGILLSGIILNFINLSYYFYVASALIVIFVFDLKHFIIPDRVLFPAIGISFLYLLFGIFDFGNFSFIGNWKLEIGNLSQILSGAVAALIASGFFLMIFLASRGKWMGFGDVKLAILMGLFLGFPNILFALFSAFCLGAIIGVVLMAFKNYGLKSEIPFGPFLITGTFLALFFGERIIEWYLKSLML